MAGCDLPPTQLESNFVFVWKWGSVLKHVSFKRILFSLLLHSLAVCVIWGDGLKLSRQRTVISLLIDTASEGFSC